MIDFGIDEGGGDDTLLVAVQFGDTAKLRHLNQDWQAHLHDVRLKFWHSKDYRNRDSGVFAEAGMDMDARRRLLADLSALIHRDMDLGLVVKVRHSLYCERTLPVFRAEYGSAYSFAIQWGLLVTAQILNGWWGEEHQREQANILLENGHKNVNQIIEQLNLVKERTAASFLSLNNVGTGPKEGNPILQAADMLAYGHWAHLNDRPDEIFDALLDRGTYQAIELTCSESIIDGTKGPLDDELLLRKRSIAYRKPKRATSA